MTRLNYTPYEIDASASVSVLHRDAAGFADDAPHYGVDVEGLPDGHFIVGIGAEPDVVLTGDRVELLRIARRVVELLG